MLRFNKKIEKEKRASFAFKKIDILWTRNECEIF